MRKYPVPAAPQPSFENIKSAEISASAPSLQSAQSSVKRSHSASTRIAPLDAAFLRRVYITTLWFGSLLTLCAYSITRSLQITLSFAGGIALAALLLKSQEMFVRRVIRPKNAPPYESWDAKIPLFVLLPGKYILIGAAFGFLLSRDLLHPFAFAGGFIAEHVVIVSKVLGRFLSQKVQPIGEASAVHDKETHL